MIIFQILIFVVVININSAIFQVISGFNKYLKFPPQDLTYLGFYPFSNNANFSEIDST